MNLSHLKFIIATAELKSFSRAAERCNVTQSTLSNGVSEVESELGSKLFERTTRNVSLSTFGKAMMPLIQTILNAETNLATQAKNFLNPEKTLIKIGVSPLLNPGFTSLLTKSFSDKHPEFEIVLYEENLSQLEKMMASNSLDFIFVPQISDFSKTKSLCLYDEPLAIITKNPDFMASKSINAKTLRTQKFVMVPDTCGLAKVTREVFKKARIPLTEYEGKAFSYGALTDWAQNGIGLAVLPKSKIQSDIKSIPLVDSNNAVERIRYVAIGNTKNNPKLKMFTDHVKETAGRLSKGLALEQSCLSEIKGG